MLYMCGLLPVDPRVSGRAPLAGCANQQHCSMFGAFPLPGCRLFHRQAGAPAPCWMLSSLGLKSPWEKAAQAGERALSSAPPTLGLTVLAVG